jgi:hypothetical protein
MSDRESVIVVAAKNAWAEYLATSCYICQAHRGLRDVPRMAFYNQGLIETLVPEILDAVERVRLSPEGIQADPHLSPELKARLQGVVTALSGMPYQEHLGKDQKVVFLSSPDSPETLRLPATIPNNKRSRDGKIVAFTYKQRYVDLPKLLASPKDTTALE